MNILIYNFVQPDDAVNKQGGGVAVYQSNLIRALRNRGHRLITMSSGDRYSLLRTVPRVEFSSGEYERAIIMDSPVFAPAHYAFYNISAYADDPGLDHIPQDLRRRYGAIDVFHFQNVEGLSAGFFRALRAEFPLSTILLTAHNYNLVCPQVNLWFREHAVCTDYKDGRACVNCLLAPDRHRHERNIRRMNAILDALRIKRQGLGMRAVKSALRAPFRARRWLRSRTDIRNSRSTAQAAPLVLTSQQKAWDYARYRMSNIVLCETVFDRVLAVSERAREVLVRQGIPGSRVAVSYIGTAHHEHFMTARRIKAIEDHLHIGYLGYMRRDKGFYFFLEGLEALPDYWASDIAVTIAAPVTDGGVVHRLKAIAHRFRAVAIHDGYSHRTLDRVLQGVSLGIVPVLWEDNLPQVAIEFVSRGIPILTSDRGGAQEIARHSDFTFQSGNREDFGRKLRDISTGRTPLGRFWDNGPQIVSMEQHVNDLVRHYAARDTAQPTLPSHQSTSTEAADERILRDCDLALSERPEARSAFGL